MVKVVHAQQAASPVTKIIILFVFLLLLISYLRRGESHWWMKGSTPTQIAEIIIKLIKDMAAVSILHIFCSYVKKKS